MGGRERADGGGGSEPVEVLYWDRYKSSFPGLDLRGDPVCVRESV